MVCSYMYNVSYLTMILSFLGKAGKVYYFKRRRTIKKLTPSREGERTVERGIDRNRYLFFLLLSSKAYRDVLYEPREGERLITCREGE